MGKPHERIKKFLAILLELYFFEAGIRFVPAGNATCEAEVQGASFDPDESYCFGQDKPYPDLGIEVIFTSGGLNKLEKYKRFKVPEVWFWQADQLQVYVLYSSEQPELIRYEQAAKSELLPNLDVALLNQCLQLTDIFESRAAFLEGLQS